jgi:hypothetical protein
MTWFSSSANELEAAKSHVHIFVAVDFDFPSGHLRLWTGVGELSFGGSTYIGVGKLGSISVPSEATNLSADKKTYQLSGVDPALVSESDIDNSFGRDVIEYFGFLNHETRQLVDTPEINWEGRIDTMRRVDGVSPIIEVNAEHRLAMLDRSDGWRYTHEHQQQFFAGDKGLEFVGTLDAKEVLWNGERAYPGTPPTTPRKRDYQN